MVSKHIDHGGDTLRLRESSGEVPRLAATAKPCVARFSRRPISRRHETKSIAPAVHLSVGPAVACALRFGADTFRQTDQKMLHPNLAVVQHQRAARVDVTNEFKIPGVAQSSHSCRVAIWAKPQAARGAAQPASTLDVPAVWARAKRSIPRSRLRPTRHHPHQSKLQNPQSKIAQPANTIAIPSNPQIA